MQDLPKIVQERLMTPPAEEHPDANLLAAFSENSLVRRERAAILQHLAVCASCREIASLALPEEELAVAAMAAAASRSAPVPLSSRGGFDFRRGALAACVVIVAGAIWTAYRPGKRSPTALPAGEIASSNSPNQEVAKLDEPSLALKDEVKQNTQIGRRNAAPGDRKPSTRSRGELALSPPSKEVGLPHVVAGNGPEAPPPPAEKAGARNEPEISGNLTIFAAPGADTEINPVAAAAPAPALAKQKRQKPQGPADEKDKRKDKRMVAGGAASGFAVGQTTLALALQNSFVRWTLSDGHLRRSSDAGKSWEEIPVGQNATFRALSVMGEQLWVGGKEGTLYHSSDNGARWVRVLPSAGDESLTEDIVRVEFADADHGKVITPHSEWRTDNCGATWQRK
jgi:hypothetical protein